MVKKAAKKKAAKKPRGRQAGSALRSFVFTGDPKDPDSNPYCSACGYLFKLNDRAVPVSKEAAERLSRNSHFTEK